MRLKLKETPREWRKFVAVWVVILEAVTILLWRKGVFGSSTSLGIGGLLVFVLVFGMIRPALFRHVFRVVMTVSFHFGQVMGKVILSVFFVLFLSPFALLLRLFGKDLLRLRKHRNATTHWQTSRPPGPLDRMF